jgi:hypothetical protein
MKISSLFAGVFFRLDSAIEKDLVLSSQEILLLKAFQAIFNSLPFYARRLILQLFIAALEDSGLVEKGKLTL